MKDDLDTSMMEERRVERVKLPSPLPTTITVHDLIAVFILGFVLGMAVIVSIALVGFD